MIEHIRPLRKIASHKHRPLRIGNKAHLHVTFMTTVHHNVGDEFIREGIRSFLDEVLGDYDPFYVHKHDIDTLHKPLLDEGEKLADKFRDSDIIVQAGAPVYWNIGPHTSYNVGWAKDLWFDRIFKLGPAKIILNIGVRLLPGRRTGPGRVDGRSALRRFRPGSRPGLPMDDRPRSARLAVSCHPGNQARPAAVPGVSCRPKDGRLKNHPERAGGEFDRDAGHHLVKPANDPAHWRNTVETVLPQLRKHYHLLFVANDIAEAEYQKQFAIDNEMVFLSNDFRDYLALYATVQGIVANRVHGAVCVAGFGRRRSSSAPIRTSASPVRSGFPRLTKRMSRRNGSSIRSKASTTAATRSFASGCNCANPQPGSTFRDCGVF